MLRRVRPGLVEVVELFERQEADGELDEAGGVEVLAGVEVVGVGGKVGLIVGVAVDLGVDDLQLVLWMGGDAGKQGGGVEQRIEERRIGFAGLLALAGAGPGEGSAGGG